MREFRIPYAIPFLPESSKKFVAQTFETGQISGAGEALSEFELRVAKRLGSQRIFAVTNGSAAIQLAYQALKVNRKTRVVLPGWGFHVAANIAYTLGAEVEFRDVSTESWCLELESELDLIESTQSTVLVLVHSLGNSSNLNLASKISSNTNVEIVEDSAQAFLSKNGERYLGTIFDIGTFSMHAAKTITTGEGGFLSVNNTNLHKEVELLRNHGMSPAVPYLHELPGSNFRLSNLLASIAHPQLDSLDHIKAERIRVYKDYAEALREIDEVSFLRESDPTGFFPWGVCIRIRNASKVFIPELRAYLAANGVDTRPGFTSAEQLPYYSETINSRHGALEVSNKLARETILLPHYPNLRTEDINSISNLIASFISKARIV